MGSGGKNNGNWDEALGGWESMTRSDLYPVLENVNVGIVIKLPQIRKEEYSHQVHHLL